LPRPPDAVGAFVDTPEEKFASSCPSTLMVIMNPFSGNGRAVRVLNVCEPVWREAGIMVTVCNTTHARHAVEIGQTSDFSAYKCVAVIGGDGMFGSIA
jgi:diacylglycerol kinase family enzyme